MKKAENTNEELCALSKQGSSDAKDLLIKRNLYFIKKTAYEIWNRKPDLNISLGIETDDLIQEGSLGMLGCIENFDPDNGNLFLTYASHAIRNAMLNYISTQSICFEAKNISDIISLDDDKAQIDIEYITDAAKRTPEQIFFEKERMNDLHHALDVISDREEQYLRYRFGFDDDIEHPLTETAKHFYLSASRAKSTEILALDNVWLELPWWY